MPKDAYYFFHDSNAKDDPKCSMLIEQLGLEGYGIYWILVETLRDQPDYKYPLNMLPILARKYNTTHEKVKVVVGKYDLFTIDDEQFLSISLCRRMEKLEKRKEQQRSAGLISAQKRLMLNAPSTDVEQPLNAGSTIRIHKIRNYKSRKEQEEYDYFSDFWSEYPKKEAKQEAIKVFATLKMNDDLMEKVMGGLFRALEKWRREEFKFVPQAPRWLRGRRWEDEIKC